MSKITKQENYRVVIEPWSLDNKYDHQTCKSILEQVNRHIDDIEYV